MNPLSRHTLGAGLVLALLLPQAASTAPGLGALDTTFNAGGTTPGRVNTDVAGLNEQARAVAIQPDGKIVIGGSNGFSSSEPFLVGRYNADGSVDTGFGNNGFSSISIGTGGSSARSLLLQADGKLVMVGTASNGTDFDFALARFDADGSLDTGFGNNGTVLTDFGSTPDRAFDIALQTDGKLVVSGYRTGAGGPSNFAYTLARYNSDGSLDTDFGTGGLVTTALGSTNDSAVYVALQADGKILIGSAYSSMGPDFFVARYTADGVLDTSFNPGGSLAAGVVTTDTGDTIEEVVALLVQPDGKILAAGTSGSDITVLRYNPDGSPDTDFDSDGIRTYIPGNSNNSTDVALQPNGKILVGGVSDVNAALVRFNADGSLDGVASDFLGVSNNYVEAVAIQPDGRLIVAGRAINGGEDDIAIARLVSSDAPWDLTPDAFSFTDQRGVEAGSLQTSNMITISGLDTDTRVPVLVSGGEFAVNGATTYSSGIGWVQNGDTLNVRTTASSTGGTAVAVVVTAGGVLPDENQRIQLGTTSSDTFTVITAGGSSGALSPWLLVLLAPLLALRLRQSLHA